MTNEDNLVYVLIELKAGQEDRFRKYVESKGLLKDPNSEHMDTVHGTYDVVITFRGSTESIDARIMEMRKSPSISKTTTLTKVQTFNRKD
jgi:hypothetical protein